VHHQSSTGKLVHDSRPATKVALSVTAHLTGPPLHGASRLVTTAASRVRRSVDGTAPRAAPGFLTLPACVSASSRGARSQLSASLPIAHRLSAHSLPAA